MLILLQLGEKKQVGDSEGAGHTRETRIVDTVPANFGPRGCRVSDLRWPQPRWGNFERGSGELLAEESARESGKSEDLRGRSAIKKEQAQHRDQNARDERRG